MDEKIVKDSQGLAKELVNDCISRQAAILAVKDRYYKYGRSAKVEELVWAIEELPSTQSEKRTDEHTEKHACDLIDRQPSYSCSHENDTISRQAAIDALHMHLMYRMGTDSNKKRLDDWINGVPSVQLERTCVNCGRTVNNGGWYADGGTRCPIEEHYALPKDGFCHLWEKRNVTDDDYPERRTDE